MRRTTRFTLTICIAFLLLISCVGRNSTEVLKSNNHSEEASNSEIIEIIKKVNDYWQQNNQDPGDAFGNRAVYHTGNMAVYELTGIEKYRMYSEKWAEKNNWKGAESEDKSTWKYKPYGEGPDFVLLGDWQICFQTYIDLYCIESDERKIERAKDVMAYQVSTDVNDYWLRTDGLYMVMPVMTKMYQLTGDTIYLDKLYEYFSYAKNLMYDEEFALFYRDVTYLYPKHKTYNGFKDFGSCGNGWIFAAMPKVLKDIPLDDPHRNEYINIYKAMAETLAASQQNEGYWSRSILDVSHAPGRETSGTALFAYGFLWGINNEVLDADKYLPVINKAWKYLTEFALQPDGKIGYVQPIGERADQHNNVDSQTTADFGVGAFLLAATEMAKCQD